MKTKLVRPILIETGPGVAFKGQLCLRSGNHSIFKIKEDTYVGWLNLQQFVLISLDSDDKIEEGESYVYWDGNKYSIRENLNCKNLPGGTVDAGIKIIAQQSQLSPEYIQQFIEEYNNGEIKDIEIEMHEEPCFQSSFSIIEPKLTNGFITIINKEPILYTEEEVENLLFKFAEDNALTSCKSEIDDFNEWVEQNKKK